MGLVGKPFGAEDARLGAVCLDDSSGGSVADYGC